MALQIAIAQINASVGDLAANAQKIHQAAATAVEKGADLLLTPELSLVGYPPEDLLLRPSFLRRSQQVLDELVGKSQELPSLTYLVGCPREIDGRVYNAALIFKNGSVLGHYAKLELPNYAVFDEQRYFQPDGAPFVFEIKGVRLGVNICEDVWFPRAAAMAKAEGAQALLVMNASPFHLNKQNERLEVVRAHVVRHKIPTVFATWWVGKTSLSLTAIALQSMVRARLLREQRAFKKTSASGVSIALATVLRVNSPSSLTPIIRPTRRLFWVRAITF